MIILNLKAKYSVPNYRLLAIRKRAGMFSQHYLVGTRLLVTESKFRRIL